MLVIFAAEVVPLNPTNIYLITAYVSAWFLGYILIFGWQLVGDWRATENQKKNLSGHSRASSDYIRQPPVYIHSC